MKKLIKTCIGSCIHESSEGIKVYQNLFYRWLTINSDALQTVINRHNPQNPVLPYINQLIFALNLAPANCCLLGLGGAAAVHAINGNKTPVAVTAVELSKEMIEIAASYFMIGSIKNLTIIHQDALVFVQQSKTLFHHLLLDLYNATCFPTQCNHYNFFKNL